MDRRHFRGRRDSPPSTDASATRNKLLQELDPHGRFRDPSLEPLFLAELEPIQRRWSTIGFALMLLTNCAAGPSTFGTKIFEDFDADVRHHFDTEASVLFKFWVGTQGLTCLLVVLLNVLPPLIRRPHLTYLQREKVLIVSVAYGAVSNIFVHPWRSAYMFGGSAPDDEMTVLGRSVQYQDRNSSLVTIALLVMSHTFHYFRTRWWATWPVSAITLISGIAAPVFMSNQRTTILHALFTVLSMGTITVILALGHKQMEQTLRLKFLQERRLQTALATEQERLMLILEHSSDLIIQAQIHEDGSVHHTWVSPSALLSLGHRPESLLGDVSALTHMYPAEVVAELLPRLRLMAPKEEDDGDDPSMHSNLSTHTSASSASPSVRTSPAGDGGGDVQMSSKGVVHPSAEETTQRPNTWESPLLAADGSQVWFEFRVSATPDVAGLVSLVGRDLTDRKARLRDQTLMMAMTCHEVRNPLNGTVGHLKLARHALQSAQSHAAQQLEQPEPAAAAEQLAPALGSSLLTDVEGALACTDIALVYLSTLAHLHSVVTGRLKFTPRRCELGDVLRTVETIVRPQMQPGVQLRLSLPADATPVVVMSDPTMLVQIVTNLAQNAARFTVQGYVQLRCDLRANPADLATAAGGGAATAVLSVEDTGPGLSREVRATFGDLYQSVGGIGLGMYLVKQLVSLLGSSLRVESPWNKEAPSTSGTAFSFSLEVLDATRSLNAEQLTALVASSRSISRLHMASNSSSMQQGDGSAAGSSSGSSVGKGGSGGQGSDNSQPPAGNGNGNGGSGGASKSSGGSGAGGGGLEFARGVRVLVADDMASPNRKLLRHAFTRFFGAEWHVAEAETAEQALAMATAEPGGYDVVVMDEIFSQEPSALRGSRAIELLRENEQSSSRVPAVVISCTGNASNADDRAQLTRSGADAVWCKPWPDFTNGEMQRIIHALLQARSEGVASSKPSEVIVSLSGV